MWTLYKETIQTLTKLEIGVVGTDVVAGAEQALHHQSRSHGVKQTEVLRDPTLLDIIPYINTSVSSIKVWELSYVEPIRAVQLVARASPYQSV